MIILRERERERGGESEGSRVLGERETEEGRERKYKEERERGVGGRETETERE